MCFICLFLVKMIILLLFLFIQNFLGISAIGSGYLNAKYTSLKHHHENCGLRNATYFNRIIGGQSTKPGEFPWVVSLQVFYKDSYTHICGGAVIDDSWIITAAHCVYGMNREDLSVVAGDHNLYLLEGYENRRSVEKVLTTNFDFSNFQNDICLLKLQKPFEFSSRIAPICLPQPMEVFEGSATTAGWGRTNEKEGNSDILKHVSFPVLNKSLCNNEYRRIGFSRYMNECQLCAGYINGGRDACQGDSGGPLMCRKDNDRYYICGIVSWGIGCARAIYPGIYTKVSCFSNWINVNIKSNN